MFTGLVEETGSVLGLELSASGGRLALRAGVCAQDLAIGDSLAVNGCCLTLAERDTRDTLYFDLLAETLRLTNLGDLGEGDLVNLERALRVGDRLGGHFVLGHIDASAQLLALKPEGEDHRLEIALPGILAPLVARKGSICVDGISLTVAEVGSAGFTCWITPHTLAATHLHGLLGRSSHRVNLEADVVARHLARMVEVGAVGDGEAGAR
jgi:riboflavin synthase